MLYMLTVKLRSMRAPSVPAISQTCFICQVGQQEVALGFKFKARAVVEVEEEEERVGDGRVQRAINFTQVEGDFKLFKGTWTIEEVGKLNLVMIRGDCDCDCTLKCVVARLCGWMGCKGYDSRKKW